MKKIFAIALALVMVLSMASAFASACSVGPFDWTCATKNNNCGKVKVEVVPYVKVNADCNDVDYVANTCAGAVKGEKVYFTMKLTVDAHVDAEWFHHSALKVDYTELLAEDGVTPKPDVTNLWVEGTPQTFTSLDLDADKEKTYYWNETTTSWEENDDDFEFGAKNLITAVVGNASKAKVCATITSKNENFTEGIVGDYKVYYEAGRGMWITEADYDEEEDPENAVFYALDEDDKVTGIFKMNDKCSTNFYNAVTSFFGITMGTCLNQDTVDANLGWDEKQESCFKWSKEAAAIVDANCVVSIPKTGDVSVVAYAVMAVVAAAGAMLKK
ncbi:MAG: hypothetical protein PUC76_07835 [Clostridia bacterium]|nr:hypothetical protein [Clostridia bacterium]